MNRISASSSRNILFFRYFRSHHLKTVSTVFKKSFGNATSLILFNTIRRFSSSNNFDNKTTYFGFKTIKEEEKEELVGKVFSSVASNYDLMNDVMSGGIHRLWKDYFVKTVAPGPFSIILDVAGGTGDISLRMLEYIRTTHGDAGGMNITVLDINKDMLKVGEQKAAALGYTNPLQLSFVHGNAEYLDDIPDNSMDVYTIAFGIRNCTHIDQVLKEAYRVLKPGGRFACLEFSHVENPLLRKIYDVYSFELIPTMGEIIAKDSASYQYLVESIRKFPNQKEFASKIQGAGFAVTGKGYEDLNFGVAAIHSGWKL